MPGALGREARDPRALLRALFDAAIDAASPAKTLARVSCRPRPRAARSWSAPARRPRRWRRRSKRPGADRSKAWSSPATAMARRPVSIEVVEAAHPTPDAAGQAAAARILDRVKGLTADDLVLCLISGGASALLALPAPGLTLDDKRAINRALLRSGADIAEINCVRKHLSAIKGGRLALAAAPAQVVGLIVPTCRATTSPSSARGRPSPIRRLRPRRWRSCAASRSTRPPRVIAHLESAASETPKPGDPRFAKVTNIDRRDAVRRAASGGRGGARGWASRRSCSAMRSRARRAKSAGLRRRRPFGRAPRRAGALALRAAVRRRNDGDGARQGQGRAQRRISARRWRSRSPARRASLRSPATPTASTAARTTPARSSPPTRWRAPPRSGSSRRRSSPTTTPIRCSPRWATSSSPARRAPTSTTSAPS